MYTDASQQVLLAERQASGGELPHRRAELAFVFIALLLFSNALIGPLLAPNQTTTDDVTWLRYLWLPIYAGSILLCVYRRKLFTPFNPAWLLFVVLVGWVALSANWSIDREVTTRRAVALAGTTLFGVYLASSFGNGAFVVIMAKCLTVLAAGSVMVALFVPAIGIHHDGLAGDWRGLWYQKNALGAMMACGVFSCFSAGLITKRRTSWLAAGGLCFTLVLLSRSKTALLCTLVPMAIYAMIWIARRGAVMATVSLFITGSLIIAFLGAMWCAPDSLLQALGKDATLTGRTDIWAAVGRQLAKHPLLGYGYGAFWLKDAVPAEFVRAETGWLVPSAHNGWLDVLVQVGWIGGVLVGIVVAVAVLAALVRGWRSDDGYWSLFFISTFVLHSISESVLISENSFDWAMFAVALTTLLSRSSGTDWAARGGLA